MANDAVSTRSIAAPLQGLTQLPALRQLGVMVGIAASVALGVAIVLWSWTPTYSLLYSSLSDKDAGQVMAALQKDNIPYRVDEASGAVMVPASQVHAARIKLAGEGLPKGSAVGFELLDKNSGFGTSRFVENVRYQRALEADLASSIMTLDNVEIARVHLAIPKAPTFLRDKEKPSASVLVKLYSGRTLDSGQVAAIVHLVASSVPDLEAARVTVVDQKGDLLTPQDPNSTMAMTSNQFQYTRRVEQSYVQRIENLLTPIVGSGKVRAQVVANVDFTTTEQTRETYNPDQPALRSEQTVDEQNSAGGGAMGVPGALSNQPPGAGVAPEQVPAKGAAGAAAPAGKSAPPEPTNTVRRATRNFELDRTISHTRLASGAVRRLSVAVLVDDKVTTDQSGKEVHTPLSAKELERITALVKDAVGFDPRRGDTVNVMSASFQAPPVVEPLPAPPLWKQPWVWNLAKMIVGGLGVLLLIFSVLRPLLRSLTANAVALPVAVGGGPGRGGYAAGRVGDDQLTLSGQSGAQRLGGPSSYEDQLQAAKSLATQDPKRVAQVVKTWVGNDG
ncbi:MAG: flagellar M-ring protein FliF [Chromatiales bacterium 21-64-14]|nr:MAG: flagellar M-ring protein FliF [Chromatiales bacterium 21-64-14]HQU15086.1 flagellar basal-body MS-ring/collar protein FliF [Gammaproteobacteria bacterium]